MSYDASASTHPSGQWRDIVGSSCLDGGKFAHLAQSSEPRGEKEHRTPYCDYKITSLLFFLQSCMAGECKIVNESDII